MAFPFSRALPILRGIDELAGPDLYDVDDAELLPWLAERGEHWDEVAFIRAMHALQDAGYVSASFKGGMSGVAMMKLEERGHQMVSGWPSSTGAVDPNALAAALAAALDAAADDPDVPEEQRGMLRRIGEGALTTAVATAVTAAFGAVGING